MFHIFRPVILGFLPWIVFSLVFVLFIAMGIGKECKPVIVTIIVLSLALGLFCMFSMIISSPLYVGIPVVIKMTLEGLLAFPDD